MISEIQDTIMEKKINVFHVVVGILFVLIPEFIANKQLTTEQLINYMSILGYVIIVVHFGTILMYHFNKACFPPSLKEEYAVVGESGTPGYPQCNGGWCAKSTGLSRWNPLRMPCCDTCSLVNYDYGWGQCNPANSTQAEEAKKIRLQKGLK